MSQHFCQRVIEGLWAAGVRDMVVSPGSRSTPLLLAALRSDLRLYSIIDERSAAFFALGRARARGTKVALLCTSGSAGAHYLPALLEARYSEHCLVALTADRPPELQDSGANQTIDQRTLFAAACPPCIELGVPEGIEALDLAASRRVHQAVSLACGPVHINLPFRKPLEPQGALVPAKRARLPAFHAPESKVAAPVIKNIALACQSAERGVIVCGPNSNHKLGPALCALAKALGFVLLAEATSGARLNGLPCEGRCDAFPHLLRSPRLAATLAPDLILQFGASPACTALGEWVSASAARHFRFGENRAYRSANAAAQCVQGDSADACEKLLESTNTGRCSAYRDLWRAADTQAWTIVQKHRSPLSLGGRISEADATAAILQSLADNTQLTLGNSLPVRSADAALPGSRRAAPRLRVLHQRGTSGIEGLIAGAIGSAIKNAASALLLGDVSCAHDIASLALRDQCAGPLAIYVIDNGGATIFSQLPVATLDLPPDEWTFWKTPPTLDLATLCAGYGIPYQSCARRDELDECLEWARLQPGVCMLQVLVAPESMSDFMGDVMRELT